MSEILCNYAVIRFLPYRETGEFVNVGVVGYFPERHFLGYHLLKRKGRIWSFFPELQKPVYTAAIDAVERELKSWCHGGPLLPQSDPTGNQLQDGLFAFTQLVRRRESILHFSEPRTRIIAAEPEEAIRTIFDDVVDRAFAKPKDYQETVMGHRVSQWLREWKLNAFYRKNIPVGDAEYSVRLPFVHAEGDVPVAAIKPLDLNRKETTSIYEHGDAWLQRMRRLQMRGTMPQRMIFAVDLPDSGAPKGAADEIARELQRLQVVVVPFSEQDRIHELAKIA